ncbi:hypothetical protein [Flavobacterium sp.]|jgi:hypothetical protein|uniref:hypothetical protein n=1 Tax=Flavobacterium sp. TaxID=239 RepID=UPI0037BEEEEF
MKTATLKTGLFGLVGAGLITLTALYLLKENDEPNLIVVSKDLVAKNRDLISWENENRNFYHSDNTGAGIACEDNVILDLNKLSSTDGKLVGKWLKDNSKYICFEDSYKHIEKAHIVTNTIFINNIENESKRRLINYEDLKSMSNLSIRILTPNENFDSIGYEGYLNFFTIFGSSPRFIYDINQIDEGSYSIPFFRSIKKRIEKELNITINEREIEFTFVSTKNPEGKAVVAFKVEFNRDTKTFKEYYNFSTDPGKPWSYKFL